MSIPGSRINSAPTDVKTRADGRTTAVAAQKNNELAFYAGQGNIAGMKQMIKEGAEVNALSDVPRNMTIQCRGVAKITPLMAAVIASQYDAVDYLLHTAKVNPNIETEFLVERPWQQIVQIRTALNFGKNDFRLVTKLLPFGAMIGPCRDDVQRELIEDWLTQIVQLKDFDLLHAVINNENMMHFVFREDNRRYFLDCIPQLLSYLRDQNSINMRNAFLQIQSELQHEDLKQIAENTESSMRVMTKDQDEALTTIQTQYQNEFVRRGGVEKIIAELRKYLFEQFESDQSKPTDPNFDPTDKFPRKRPAYNGHPLSFECNKEMSEAERALYYKDVFHTAWRYLSTEDKPNPLMSPTASYVYRNLVSGLSYPAIRDEDKELIAYLWLAASDPSIEPVGMTRQKMMAHFVEELAYINRGHNWDNTRIVTRRNGSVGREYYDDMQGDKPSCSSGVRQRLFQAVLGNPLLNKKPLTPEIILEEFWNIVQSKFTNHIDALRRSDIEKICQLIEKLCVDMEDLTPDEQGVLSAACAIKTEDLFSFYQKMIEKYGQTFSPMNPSKLYVFKRDINVEYRGYRKYIDRLAGDIWRVFYIKIDSILKSFVKKLEELRVYEEGYRDNCAFIGIDEKKLDEMIRAFRNAPGDRKIALSKEAFNEAARVRRSNIYADKAMIFKLYSKREEAYYAIFTPLAEGNLKVVEQREAGLANMEATHEAANRYVGKWALIEEHQSFSGMRQKETRYSTYCNASPDARPKLEAEIDAELALVHRANNYADRAMAVSLYQDRTAAYYSVYTPYKQGQQAQVQAAEESLRAVEEQRLAQQRRLG